jgi:phosphoglycerate dehydrogenase-like enzyme
MMENPDVLFMNQRKQVREWFMRGPTLEKIDELGWEVRYNETDEPLEDEEWADLVEGADVLLTTWGAPELNETVLGKNNTLKFVGHVGGSVAAYVTDYLYELGVPVCTANPLMARTVAEAVLMHMLMGLKRVHKHVKLGTRSEKMEWYKDADLRVPEDCVIGIWGYGDISQWLVHYLHPFDPKDIIVCSGHMTDQGAAEAGFRLVEFDEIFSEADCIFCLAGMTVANKGKVGPEQLQSIKDGALLIQPGRAPLIQREPLYEELSKERFTGIFDVYYSEPLPDDDPLNDMPNVILNPHNAGSGRDDRYMKAMLEEAERFFNDEELLYEVSRSRARAMTDMGSVKKSDK